MASVESADILFQEAERLGLHPEKLTTYGVFSLTYKGEKHYAFDSRTTLNSQIAGYLAQNKHATRKILEEHHLPNIPYLLPATKDEAKAFLNQHKQIVVKPTLGTHSRNVYVIGKESDLDHHDLSSSIIEKYIHGREFRYLILDKEVIAVHERLFDGLINNPETVRRISFPESEWDDTMKKIAIGAAAALGLVFAAVDFKITEKNEALILEINSSPGLEWFHNPTKGPAVNVARLLLQKMLAITT